MLKTTNRSTSCPPSVCHRVAAEQDDLLNVGNFPTITSASDWISLAADHVLLYSIFVRLRRNALPRTLTSLNAIAPAAIAGLSKPAAAMGMATTL